MKSDGIANLPLEIHTHSNMNRPSNLLARFFDAVKSNAQHNSTLSLSQGSGMEKFDRSGSQHPIITLPNLMPLKAPPPTTVTSTMKGQQQPSLNNSKNVQQSIIESDREPRNSDESQSRSSTSSRGSCVDKKGSAPRPLPPREEIPSRSLPPHLLDPSGKVSQVRSPNFLPLRSGNMNVNQISPHRSPNFDVETMQHVMGPTPGVTPSGEEMLPTYLGFGGGRYYLAPEENSRRRSPGGKETGLYEKPDDSGSSASQMPQVSSTQSSRQADSSVGSSDKPPYPPPPPGRTGPSNKIHKPNVPQRHHPRWSSIVLGHLDRDVGVEDEDEDEDDFHSESFTLNASFSLSSRSESPSIALSDAGGDHSSDTPSPSDPRRLLISPRHRRHHYQPQQTPRRHESPPTPLSSTPFGPLPSQQTPLVQFPEMGESPQAQRRVAPAQSMARPYIMPSTVSSVAVPRVHRVQVERAPQNPLAPAPRFTSGARKAYPTIAGAVSSTTRPVLIAAPGFHPHISPSRYSDEQPSTSTSSSSRPPATNAQVPRCALLSSATSTVHPAVSSSSALPAVDTIHFPLNRNPGVSNARELAQRYDQLIADEQLARQRRQNPTFHLPALAPRHPAPHELFVTTTAAMFSPSVARTSRQRDSEDEEAWF